nr:immunoglobulin light chain junction region [Macaca mulatta]
CQKFSSSPNSF